MKSAVLAIGAMMMALFFIVLQLAIVVGLPLLLIGACLRYLGYV
jgi:hypothetical protein